MHKGRYQLGDEFRLTLITRNSVGVPTDPDEAPYLDVYGPSGLVFGGHKVAPLDQKPTTGLFSYSLFLGSDFSAGGHQAEFRYKVSGSNFAETFSFDVAGGGGDSGTVVALYPYEKAHAKFLIQQRTSGGVYVGKNPRPS